MTGHYAKAEPADGRLPGYSPQSGIRADPIRPRQPVPAWAA